MAFTAAGTGAAAAPPGYTAPPELMQEAETNFREGLRLMAQQKWQKASEKLHLAFLVSRTYDAAVHLGLAEYQLGSYPRAAGHISLALRHWPLLADKELKAIAKKRMEELRKRLATVTVWFELNTTLGV